ncbi:MAG: hypothetical protein WAW88_14795 [Nocardioides sp.]
MSEPAERAGDSAKEWIALQSPIWVPYLWWAILVGSIIASMSGDQGGPCSVEAPCAPDAIFPLVVALVGMSAAATWWLPITGLAVGAAYGLLGALYDPSAPGRYAGALTACVALGLLLFIRSLRGKQADVAAEASMTAALSEAPPPNARRKTPSFGRISATVLGAGGLGLLVLIGSVLGYRHQTRVEEDHLSRATTVQARVITWTDSDFHQAFRIESGDRSGARVSIEVFEELPRESVWPVMLDPEDPSWARLVSEPKGYTWWFGWALVGGSVALWSLGFLWLRWRSRPRETPGVTIEIDLRGDTAALILPPGGKRIAMVDLAGLPRGGATRRVRSATVRGPIADGAWVTIETKDGPLPVDGPMRSVELWRGNLLPSFVLSDRANSLWDHLAGALFALWHGLLVTLGGVVIGFALWQAGPAWAAAHGEGVPGSILVTSESCGKRCSYYGDFRSDDGRHVFKDVELIGASGDVGSSIPAYYEGDSPNPTEVYAPGWGGLLESGFFLGLGVFIGGASLLRLLETFARRRRPPTGRHGAPPE